MSDLSLIICELLNAFLITTECWVALWDMENWDSRSGFNWWPGSWKERFDMAEMVLPGKSMLLWSYNVILKNYKRCLTIASNKNDVLKFRLGWKGRKCTWFLPMVPLLLIGSADLLLPIASNLWHGTRFTKTLYELVEPQILVLHLSKSNETQAFTESGHLKA